MKYATIVRMHEVEKMSRETKDLTNGRLSQQFLVFSLPLMVTNVLQVLFNMADVAVVGKFAGANALGAVGSTTMLVALFTGILIGVSSGINILVALAVGLKSEKDIRETVHTAFLISAGIGILLMIVGVSFSPLILKLLHTKEELISGASAYLRVYFLGLPALALYNFGNAVFSAVGDTKRPLLFLSVAGVLNVCLNLFFVIGFDMDVLGVAIASVIAQYTSAFLILNSLFRCGQSYGLNAKLIRLEPAKAVRILKLGIPAGMQNAIFYVANMFVQMGVNSFDAVVVAGNSAAANADNLIYDMMAAFYTACGSFIGQNLGARKKDRMIKSYFICMFDAFILALAAGVLLEIFGEQFLSLFTDDAAVMAAGMERLRVMGFSYCISSFMDTAIAASRSLGKSFMPTVIVITGSCIFRVIWIYTVFAYFGTTTSLYLLFVCSWVITALAGNIYFAGAYRKTVKSWQE